MGPKLRSLSTARLHATAQAFPQRIITAQAAAALSPATLSPCPSVHSPRSGDSEDRPCPSWPWAGPQALSVPRSPLQWLLLPEPHFSTPGAESCPGGAQEAHTRPLPFWSCCSTGRTHAYTHSQYTCVHTHTNTYALQNTHIHTNTVLHTQITQRDPTEYNSSNRAVSNVSGEHRVKTKPVCLAEPLRVQRSDSPPGS